jgi:hypothetical protein
MFGQSETKYDFLYLVLLEIDYLEYFIQFPSFRLCYIKEVMIEFFSCKNNLDVYILNI